MGKFLKNLKIYKNGGENIENPAKRDKDLIRFLKWIRKYPGWWYLICTPDDTRMDIEMMNRLIKQLAKEQFYEIIFVLLMVHKNSFVTNNVFDISLLDMIIENWQGNAMDKEQIINNIANLIT